MMGIFLGFVILIAIDGSIAALIIWAFRTWMKSSDRKIALKQQWARNNQAVVDEQERVKLQIADDLARYRQAVRGLDSFEAFLRAEIDRDLKGPL
jgi:hypothetical protein